MINNIQQSVDDRNNLENKNVLVIAHRYSHFTKEQVDELAKRVNEVHVYVRYNRLTDLNKLVESETLKQYGTHDKVVESTPENVSVHTTPLTYLPVDSWYRYLGKHHYAAVRRQVAKNPVEFDIIHSHFTWTAGYVGAKLGEKYDIPSVMTIHQDVDRLDHELEWENSDLEWALENTDAIIRVNERDCERLRAFNNNVHSIPNGYDRDRFPLVETADARDNLGLPQDASIIFSLGTLIPRKRPKALLRAVSQLETEEKLICAIAGRGEQREEVEELADELSGDIDIRILGYISDEELASWMNACDIFALASSSEGNPTVMFEALGCGKPYVGTNVGGVDEIITSDQYGLYCPPGSEAELVAILQTALDTEWNRQEILEYAEQFTWEEIVERIFQVYTTLWDESREPTPTPQ